MLGQRARGANAGSATCRSGAIFDASRRIRGVDVVRLGLDGDRWGVPFAGEREPRGGRRVREVIELVGASAYAHRPIGESPAASSSAC